MCEERMWRVEEREKRLTCATGGGGRTLQYEKAGILMLDK
jgi:hypothetical protein